MCVCDLSVHRGVRGERGGAEGARPSRLATEIDDKNMEAGGQDAEHGK